ncbi:MAG: NfeD family protein [Dehalococcoidales bacterium]|nr:NfeD family protein [Dehalococcoidales bacterium]
MRIINDKGTVKRILTDWGKVLLLLLDEAAVVLLVIVVLHFFKIAIPLPTTIVLAVLLGAFVFVIHVAVIPIFHRRIVTGSQGMLGTQGRVITLLNPVGTVIIKGEYWRAKSVEDNIEVDENIEAVGIDGLTLNVKRKGD